jgi:glyoxylase-like metal-dependent hydrolase (beta-lactamase superfamily II)
LAEDYILIENNGFELFIHDLDASSVEKPDDQAVLSPLFGLSSHPLKVYRRLIDKDVIDLGGLTLEVLHTPGHTPGSICLYESESKTLFTGDTVFADGVGRTDLPGGDFAALKASLRKLIDFTHKHGVSYYHPGHGPQGSTEDLEKLYGRFF